MSVTATDNGSPASTSGAATRTQVVQTTPSAPRTLQATPGTSVGQIKLTWLTPTSNGNAAITAYKVYRASGSPYALVATVGGSTLTYTDSGLTALQRYDYYVTAVNAVGEGPASNTACAKPYPNPLGGC
jgi:hypothetical protein